MPRFLVYGSINLDKCYSLDHINQLGETQSSTWLEVLPGGKGANQAASLAKSGADTYMAGKISSDGEWICSLLSSYGVNTSKVLRTASHTGEAVIQLDKNGQNSIFLFSGGNGENQPAEMDETISAFSAGDWLVCQNEISNLDYLIYSALKKGMHVCLNPSPFTKQLLHLPLDKVDVIMVNEVEAVQMSGQSVDIEYSQILDCLCERYPDVLVVMTIGKEGAIARKGQLYGKGKIIESPVVDTTGAGDTFTGYFLTSFFVENLSLEESLNTACRASSIAVSRKGAMTSMPRRDELLSL